VGRWGRKQRKEREGPLFVVFQDLSILLPSLEIGFHVSDRGLESFGELISFFLFLLQNDLALVLMENGKKKGGKGQRMREGGKDKGREL